MPPVRWITVGRSEEIPSGRVRAADVDGMRVVVWRGVSGHLCAMEARCPHQWSDLGTEGVVEGDELVCSAHCWRFGADGRGWKVNVNGRRDEKGGIGLYGCRERDGLVEIAGPAS